MKKKGRGLSYDEKREKMLKIFHNTVLNHYYILLRKQSIIINKYRNYQ